MTERVRPFGSYADRSRSVQRTRTGGTVPADTTAPQSRVQREGAANIAEGTRNLVHAGAQRNTSTHAGPGGTQVDTYTQGPSFDIDGNASARANGAGFDVDVNLKIDANLVQAGASVTKDIKFRFQGEEFCVRVTLGADTQVGANGELKLQLSVGPNGVSANVGAEGFAGAKGTLSGSIELSANGRELASTSASVTFAAGAMAGASFEAGLTHFRAKAYAAVGVGVGVELAGEVNAMNVARLLPQLVEPSDLRQNAEAVGRLAVNVGAKVLNKLNPFD